MVRDAKASTGVSRRDLLKYCAMMAALLAKPPSAIPAMVDALTKPHRLSVVWLGLQGCQGCTYAMIRAHSPPLEDLLLNQLSLDYHLSLQVASGIEAEAMREDVLRSRSGEYLLIVEGAVPANQAGYAVIAGQSGHALLTEMAHGAAGVIALGSCAAFGGIVAAQPNPTGAASVGWVIGDRPLINLPGCPPMPAVISGVILHYLTWGAPPELDHQHRPKAFYGETIHDRCYRRPFFDQGKFAETFDDEAARRGWCLYQLGCKGATTHNACASIKWNQGSSFPVQSGHGCLGCAEPQFWDAGGFYLSLANSIGSIQTGAGVGLAAGAAVGAALAASNQQGRRQAKRQITIHPPEEEA